MSAAGGGGGGADRTGYTDDRYSTEQLPGAGTAADKMADAANTDAGKSGELSQSGAQTGGQSSQPPTGAAQPTDAKSAPGRYAAGEDPEQQLDNQARAAAAAAAAADEDFDQKHTPAKVRGKNWAIANGNPGMIPIRRSIQIVIRDDALALMPEATTTGEVSAAGREFPIGEEPGAAYEDLISAVEKRIRDWGMAGQGLYWRPVLELKVSGTGDYRVDPLLRLLKDSGAEIRSGAVSQQTAAQQTAVQQNEGSAHGTTR
jgi:hypothetical protein